MRLRNLLAICGLVHEHDPLAHRQSVEGKNFGLSDPASTSCGIGSLNRSKTQNFHTGAERTNHLHDHVTYGRKKTALTMVPDSKGAG
jgi:hypothetical protein